MTTKYLKQKMKHTIYLDRRMSGRWPTRRVFAGVQTWISYFNDNQLINK